MKNLLILFSLFIVLHANAQELPQNLSEAYQTYQENFPTEKIYIHTDRTLFKPGETVWFNTYLTDAQHQTNTKSQVVFVELINPRGNVEKRLNLRKRPNGSLQGEFVVGAGNIGGIYKIRAYTNWMRNWGEDFYFEKEITVQNVIVPKLLMTLDFEKEAYSAGQQVIANLEVREPNDQPLFDYDFDYKISIDGKIVNTQKGQTNKEGKAEIAFFLPQNLNTTDGLINILFDFEGTTESISRSIPIILNNVSMQFFPEGGYMLAGMESRIAFEALNEFGKPADVKGMIKNNLGQVIANFESYHQGLGAFEFQPTEQEQYFVELTSPSNQVFELPKSISKGIGIRQMVVSKEKATYYIHTSQPQTLHIVAEIGGKIYHQQTIKNAQSNTLDISTTDLPMGIMKLTVFDEKLRPQVERLTFINQHREVNIDIEFDKTIYAPKDLVQMTLTVKDNTGMPVVGNFSASVVEDKWHTFADDKQDNILSYLLMSAELKGEIYEPNFYFDKKESKAQQALDYVMLTHGWRRFGWREILEKEATDWTNQISYKYDQFYAKGVIRLNGDPVKDAKVYFKEIPEEVVRTDKDGNFALSVPKGLNISSRLTIMSKYRGFKAQYPLYWNNYHYDQPENKQKNEVAASIQDLQNTVLKVNVKEDEAKEETIADAKPAIQGALQKQVSGLTITADKTVERIQAMPPLALSSAAVEEIVVVGYGTQVASNSSGSGYDMDLNLNAFARPELSVRPIYAHNYFYYGRTFYSPNYNYYRNKRYRKYISSRNDLRKTLFFAPNLATNANGQAKFNCYASDENTTFRVIVEGISKKGEIGRLEETFTVQSPFNIELKTPPVVTTNDNFVVEVLMKNNTNEAITLEAKEINTHSSYFRLASNAKKSYTVPANDFIRERLYLDAGASKGERYIHLNFVSNTFSERSFSKVKILPKGFKTGFSYAGDATTKKITFQIDDIEQGTLNAQFNAYSNVIGQLMDGVKSMIREPHGCFEQVSSSNYPNIYALQYMDEMKMKDPETRKRAKSYLSKAYVKLAGYECNGGGFDWYGDNPADERLTAYGLLEFMDMKQVYSRVDQSMIDRTAAWLASRMNTDGSWQGGYYYYRRYGAVHNAYITYAMSAYGKINIQKSIELISKEARESKDWYRLTLATMSNWNAGNVKEAKALLDILVQDINQKTLQHVSTQKTITYSYGYSRNIETWAWIAQALIQQKRPEYQPLLEECIQKIVNSGNGRGYYYSTQATVQALKALVEYSRNFKKKSTSGDIFVRVNGQAIQRQHYDSNHPRRIQFAFDKFLRQGENTIEITFRNTERTIPYSTNITWNTLQPQSSSKCKVALKTTITDKETKVGETIRLSSTITNTSSEDVFNPIALVGIPAGLSLQPWQLKELKEKTAFDYYEIQNNYLVLYFRDLKANESKTVNFDLKADIAGIYKGAASSAYLYYGAEDKNWQKGLNVTIKP